METLFFIASKILGVVARVETGALILLPLGDQAGLRGNNLALKEYLGTLVYRLTGK